MSLGPAAGPRTCHATSARYKTLTLAPPGQPPGQRSAHWSRSRGPSRRSRQVGGGHQTPRCLRALLNTPSKSWRNSGAAAAAARPRRRGRGPDRLRYLIAPKMQEPGLSVPARAPTSRNGGKSTPSGRTAWQWRIARSRDRYWCTCAQSSPSVLAFYVPREDGASLPTLPNDRRVASLRVSTPLGRRATKLWFRYRNWSRRCLTGRGRALPRRVVEVWSQLKRRRRRAPRRRRRRARAPRRRRRNTWAPDVVVESHRGESGRLVRHDASKRGGASAAAARPATSNAGLTALSVALAWVCV